MKITDIKAPADLKKRTLALMKQVPENRPSPWILRSAVTAACALVLAVAFVFGGLFSGPDAVDPQGSVLVSRGTETTEKDGRTDAFDESSLVSQGLVAAGKDEQTVAFDGQGSAAQLAADNSSPRESASGILTDPDHLVPYYSMPSSDHTSADDIAAIQAAFSVQCPLINYRVSCAYNDFQENGEPLHPRIDMAAPEGTDIYPLCDGTVLEAGYSAGQGRYIVIDHGDGLVSSYAHCKELLVSEGDTVSATSVIATVGKTGRATGPFLAFSVTWNGNPVNPEALFN